MTSQPRRTPLSNYQSEAGGIVEFKDKQRRALGGYMHPGER